MCVSVCLCVCLCVCLSVCVSVSSGGKVRHELKNNAPSAFALMPVRAAVMSLIKAGAADLKVSYLHCYCSLSSPPAERSSQRPFASCCPQRMTFFQPSSRCLRQREFRPFAPSSVDAKMPSGRCVWLDCLAAARSHASCSFQPLSRLCLRAVGLCARFVLPRVFPLSKGLTPLCRSVSGALPRQGLL